MWGLVLEVVLQGNRDNAVVSDGRDVNAGGGVGR